MPVTCYHPAHFLLSSSPIPLVILPIYCYLFAFSLLSSCPFHVIMPISCCQFAHFLVSSCPFPVVILPISCYHLGHFLLSSCLSAISCHHLEHFLLSLSKLAQNSLQLLKEPNPKTIGPSKRNKNNWIQLMLYIKNCRSL